MATFSVDAVEIFGRGVLKSEGVVIDKENNVYGGGRNAVMYKVNPEGKVSELCTLPAGSIPNGVTMDRQGNVVYCDLGKKAMMRVTQSGQVSMIADRVGTLALTLPNFASYDAEGNLYVSNSSTRDIKTALVEMSTPEPGLRRQVMSYSPAMMLVRHTMKKGWVGARHSHPHEQMVYIVSGHMDGHGWGEAANDDGSGTALVLELARLFSASDVTTDRSIRFALWNNEETGLNGARAYVEQRQALQGKEDPAGSGKYPEPTWLGMIQHDMMLFDHGMPRADGTLGPEQRPEADVNIEFQSNSKFADAAQRLAWVFHAANEKYATDYPASVGPHMTNTDSGPFQDLVAAISLRENERGMQIGAGWDPNWHQPTDRYATYSDKDFRLGLNAAQTTLAAIAGLVGATLK